MMAKGVVRRVARQVKATQTLNSDHLALNQHLSHALDCPITGRDRRLEIGDLEPDVGTAHRTRIRLGVEAPVRRIVVLRLAIGAHHKGCHRRLGPVVGDILDDGEPRTTVGAVNEGVTITPVVRVEKLAQAIVADGHVGRDGQELTGLSLRVPNDKTTGFGNIDRGRRHTRSGDVLDAGQRRRVGHQSLDELVQHVVRAHSLDLYAGGTVEHPTGELQFGGQIVDKGAEPHPLYDAFDVNMPGGKRTILDQ
jgi:hypothetical protein